MRLVLIIITYLLFIPAGNTADFSKYKSTCSDIGFTPDTDPFADCVLKLYKRDRAKIKAQVNKEIENQREREREQALEIERQAIERERQVERQNQANYERERLRIERQRLEMERQRASNEEAELNRRRSLMLLNLGQGLLNPAPTQPPAPTNRTMNCESVTTNLPNSPAQIICR